MTRIYLDSAPVIYTVEGVAPFAAAVDRRLAAPGVVCVSSELARMECRIRPSRAGDAALLRDFDDFFANAVSEMVLLARDVFQEATAIRAKYNFRTPDAIHLAAAVVAGCSAFLTNDHRLSAFTTVPIEIL